MKNGVNKVILVGRIGKDPELIELQNNNLLKFSLATGERYKNKKTGEWKESTEWHSIVVWGPRAEGLSRILRKGEPLYIEGKITTRKWEDKGGNNRYKTEIIAQDVKLLGSKDKKSSSGQEHSDDDYRDYSDDDLPF